MTSAPAINGDRIGLVGVRRPDDHEPGVSPLNRLAAVRNSCTPFSATRRDTVPTRSALSGTFNSRRTSERRAAETRAGSNTSRSTPLPRYTRRCGSPRPSLAAHVRSSSLWNSSRSEARAATDSSASTGARLRRRSFGVAYRPCTVFTTQGTFVYRAASRPMIPGFGLCVWSRSNRSRRRIAMSSRSAAASADGLHARVMLRHGTCRIPAASISPTHGPGAQIAVTSNPSSRSRNS